MKLHKHRNIIRKPEELVVTEKATISDVDDELQIMDNTSAMMTFPHTFNVAFKACQTIGIHIIS